MSKITVLGAGGWGIALAISAFRNGHSVNIWSPFAPEVEMLQTTRTNEKLLKGIVLPDEINITTDIGCAADSEITIIAVPSIAVRDVAEQLNKVSNTGIIVNVAKGFEKNGLLRLSQVIEQEMPNKNIVVLSGPSHAEEVARNIETSLVAASESIAAAEIVQSVMSSETLRIYTAEDVIGVEIGGALKNVIAVCVGICSGMGLGDNTKAALMSRGLAEMSRLGVCMGAKEHTFAGLTGIGDLIVTCTSVHSRNNRFGNMVGKGMDVSQALKEVGTVEGYYAADIAYRLSQKYNIEMPITTQCYNVLYCGKEPRDVITELMNRPQKNEH